MKALRKALLLIDATTTVTGSSSGPGSYGKKSFHASVTGSGTVTATVLVEVSNDNINFFVMGTITLTGTTVDADGFISDAPWLFHRGRISAISGTGATVQLIAAEEA